MDDPFPSVEVLKRSHSTLGFNCVAPGCANAGNNLDTRLLNLLVHAQQHGLRNREAKRFRHCCVEIGSAAASDPTDMHRKPARARIEGPVLPPAGMMVAGHGCVCAVRHRRPRSKCVPSRRPDTIAGGANSTPTLQAASWQT